MGLKVKSTVQLFPAPSVGVRQVELGPMEYGVAAVTVTELTVMDAALWLVKVSVCAALCVPFTTLPKATVPELTEV